MTERLKLDLCAKDPLIPNHTSVSLTWCQIHELSNHVIFFIQSEDNMGLTQGGRLYTLVVAHLPLESGLRPSSEEL